MSPDSIRRVFYSSFFESSSSAFHPSFISLCASISPGLFPFFFFFHSSISLVFISSIFLYLVFFFLFSVPRFSLPPFLLDFFLSFFLYFIPLNSSFLSFSRSDVTTLSIINQWPGSHNTEVI